MNSYGGFVSHYRDCFAQERRYIIKGGPGCGKSTLMRRIAHEAEQRGLEVEYYDCSSDPDSLDGIVLPSLGIAMFDGTRRQMHPAGGIILSTSAHTGTARYCVIIRTK